MLKFLHQDIVPIMRWVVATNTDHYKSDLTYDLKKFYDVCKRGITDTTRYYFWFARETGVECECIYDLLNADQTSRSRYYNECEKKKFVAFIIRLEEVNGPEIIGSMVKVDFADFCKEISRNSFHPDYYDVVYSTEKESDVSACLLPEELKRFIRYGGVTDIRYDGRCRNADEERSLNWLLQKMHSLFKEEPNDNIASIPTVSDEMGYVKTLCVQVGRGKEMKKFYFTYHADYCVDEKMALDHLKQAVKEWLNSEEGINKFGYISELENWIFPKKNEMDWAYILKNIPEEYLLKYNIRKSLETYEIKWLA